MTPLGYQSVALNYRYYLNHINSNFAYTDFPGASIRVVDDFMTIGCCPYPDDNILANGLFPGFEAGDRFGSGVGGRGHQHFYGVEDAFELSVVFLFQLIELPCKVLVRIQ